MTAGRLTAWILPGFAVSASVSLAMGAFAYNWRHPDLTEMQVLQAFPEWWASYWPLGLGLMLIYVARSLWIPRLRP